MSATAVEPETPESQDRSSQFFGHPRGLTILFLTEMWADFSYFGMRALLVYYMTLELAFSLPTASAIYGGYTALAHLTPILGGIIADRIASRRFCVTAGSLIMAAGHFMMAFEALFFPALATIALGIGLFLPSLPGQVGALYREGDSRRDRAFSIYYIGINIGSFLAPLVCGTLGEAYGWHYGFGAAGVGMFIGLLVYLLGGRWLPQDRPRTAAGHRDGLPSLMVQLRPLLFPLLVLAGAVILFRIAYEQIGNSIALWAGSGVDRSISLMGESIEIPMTWFQSLNPVFIFLLTPFILKLWARQSRQGREPPTAIKMAIGAGLLGSAYLLVMVASAAYPDGGTPWFWLIGFILVLTIGELFFMPIGLSLVSRIAPSGYQVTMLGLWFFLAFVANLFAGLLGAGWSLVSTAQFFGVCATVAGSAALVMYLLRASLARLDEPRLRGDAP